MSEYSERQAEAKRLEAARTKEAKRLAAIACETFSTEAGQELLSHLCKRFDLIHRTFIPDPSTKSLCPLRAAVRDGERSAVSYLIHLIRSEKPNFPIPL